MSSYSESESEGNARGRVKKLMDEIYSQRDNLKTDADVDKMADQCTKMLVDMIDRAKGKGSSSKVKKSATNPPAEKDLGLGMPLKDYARRRDRPDFEKIYKGRVDNILKSQAKNKEWRSKTGEPSSASSLTSSGSESASGSSEEENEVRDPLAGGDFAGRRDFDAMKKKAEEWLKKHEVDMGGFSSSGDEDPALLSKLARPLQNLLKDQSNAPRARSKPQPDKASSRRMDYPASLRMSSSSKPSTSLSSSRKPPPSSTTSKTTSKKPTKTP